MGRVEIPCAKCMGTGKVGVCVDEGEAMLPLVVLLKVNEIFQHGNAIVQEDFNGGGFVIRVAGKGTMVELHKKEDEFNSWLLDNYPPSISHRIGLAAFCAD